MTEETSDGPESNSAPGRRAAVESAAAGSSYKVRGKFSDASGAGVLGENTAGSGTPVGVKGVVPNSSGGYGLHTPDDARIEGAISTGETDFVVEAATTATSGGTNVILGHASNQATSGVDGAVIGGGGSDDGTNQNPNRVTRNWGTISGGRNNTASGYNSTVGGGFGNVAGSSASTVGGGFGNTALGYEATVAGGDDNDAHGAESAIGGGADNRTGTSGTAKGDNATVPGGSNNVARENYSFAAGRQAEAHHEGAFVWADATSGSVTSATSNSFIVAANGGVGVGTNDPATQLHVVDSVSGGAGNTANHVAAIENRSSDGSADVLELKINESTSNIGNENNFITFKNGGGSGIGAIEGDGSGVTLNTSNGDYAEYLPRLHPEEPIEPGDVVGVVDGGVTRRTAEADQALVVSKQPIVTGNSPGLEPRDREGHEVCAFLGQVPVKVDGPVAVGDLVLPSGEHDGTGRAIAPMEYRPGDAPIVGRAWESDDTATVTQVTVAVGLEAGEALESVLVHQRERIDDLEAETGQLRDALAAKDDRIADLEARLAALETRVDGRPAPADD